MTVFHKAIDSSRPDSILVNRLRIIKDRLTQLVYDFTCMGIFERHKLMFSFQMITMIMDGDDKRSNDWFGKKRPKCTNGSSVVVPFDEISDTIKLVR